LSIVDVIWVMKLFFLVAIIVVPCVTYSQLCGGQLHFIPQTLVFQWQLHQQELSLQVQNQRPF
jgi:hypothetical protein